MFNIRTTVKGATGYSRLLTFLVTATVPGTGDPAVFLVRKLNDTVSGDDVELVCVASWADMQNYDTTVVYPGLYRKATITVCVDTAEKLTIVKERILADIRLILEYQVARAADPDSETVTFQDTKGTTGPFVFSDLGEIA